MRYTTSNGKKKDQTSSEEAYKKLAWYENDEDRGIIPEEFRYSPEKIQSTEKGKFQRKEA